LTSSRLLNSYAKELSIGYLTAGLIYFSPFGYLTAGVSGLLTAGVNYFSNEASRAFCSLTLVLYSFITSLSGLTPVNLYSNRS
jgi:hypothetical protein